MDDLLADFLTETHEGLSAVDEALAAPAGTVLAGLRGADV